jgi:hypothetical protein
MEENYFIFSEIVRCGIIGRVAYDTFHKFHPTLKLHIFGRKEDFEHIIEHPNNILHELDNYPEIIKAFDSGHVGTSMVWAKVMLEAKENYIIHFDSDVVFRGDMVQDVINYLQEYDIVGGMRNYPNNPNNRDDVRHLPDLTQTYCFGFNKSLNYITDSSLLARFIENSVDNNVVTKARAKYPEYGFLPTIDFFDPIAFNMMKIGASIKIIDKDVIGGTNDEGKRINKYGILNRDMDFGDKIAHFASVGSGLNFLNMMNAGKHIDVPQWYVDYALGKLDLYMRLFYDKKILDDEKNKTFLELEGPLRKAFFDKLV